LGALVDARAARLTRAQDETDILLRSRLTADVRRAYLNGFMPNERHQQAPARDKPNQPPQQKGGRSGEGSRSVLPHLKADQRARAVGSIPKRLEREF
jgi:hypothetical protein